MPPVFSSFLLVCLFVSMPLTPLQGGRAAQTAQTRTEDIKAFRESFLGRDRSYSSEARSVAEKRLAALEARVAEITQPAFELELARIVALADNGHTHYVLGSIQRYYNRVPIRLGTFGGEFYVLRAKGAARDLAGARLMSIDGHGVEQLRQAGRELWGGLPAFRDQFSFNLFESPDLLHAAGLAAKPESAVFRFVRRDGTEVERRLDGEPPDSSRPFAGPDRTLFPEPLPLEDAAWTTALAPAQAPWSLQHFRERFRWRPAPEINGLVVELRQNMDSADAKIAPALKEFGTAIDDAKPVNLVVDMRLNGGGNLNLTRDFMKSLPARVSGRIFVLTSPFTFSAAISSVAYLKQAAPDRVTIVGEHVGDRLVFFAEGRGTDLPNNLGMIGMATERHDYQNGCKTFTDCHRAVVANPIAVPTLAPEISAPWTIDAYLSGSDPAIDAVRRALSGR
jgi:hypothetical protein